MVNTQDLRISAENAHKLIFSHLELHDFIYWLGYVASDGSNSMTNMSKSLEKYCNKSHRTIYRWVEGTAKPDGSSMLMIYGGVMASRFEGNQNALVYSFLSFHDKKLRDQLFM